MRNKKQNDEGKLLFVVNYVERPSLKDCCNVRITHSLERAIERVKDLLASHDDVLYCQVAVYRYSSIFDCYKFITLRNFYGFSSFETNCKKMDDMLFNLFMMEN